jgi:ATP-dependent DNA helicase RecG
MSSVFDKLTKILSLEQNQGYRDRAVIGGLERFVPVWEVEAQQALANQPERLALAREIIGRLDGYGAKDRAGREATITAVLERLAHPEAPTPPRPAPGPPPLTTVEAQPTMGGPGTPAVGEEVEGLAGEVLEAEPVVAVATPPPRLRPERPRPVAPRRAEPPPGVGLDAPVTRLPGINTAYAKKLERLGVTVIRDLLYLFPRRYDDFSALKTINQLQSGEEVTIVGTVWQTSNRDTHRGLVITESVLSDGTGSIKATWFNQPYLLQQLRPGRQVVLSGKVDLYLGRLVFQSPEWELLDRELIHTARIVPVYPLTEGLGAKWMRRLMRRTVDAWAPRGADPLPEGVRQRWNLFELPRALAQIHFPDSHDELRQARRRLSFDEFLLIQLGALRQRHLWRKEEGQPLQVDQAVLSAFLDGLPFKLTGAQQRVLGEILADLQQPRPMSRLLQGDVGSGKTVVATAAMLVTAANGAQSVLMAPTEILAEQHYSTITRLLNRKAGDWRIGLLTGSLKQSDKETMRRAIAAGEVNVVVGTHALIQEGVEFDNLALAIVDEQHRFGVAQRASLRTKGCAPHVLVMTATPIPRTLALTIYGDLDISVIDEMPPGRWEIKTRWLAPRERDRAYNFVRRQVRQGRQAFVICPLIEESDKVEAKAAVAEYERLQREIFPDLKLGLLHGKMRPDEKDVVMAEFYRGELDILVSTPVVEVGIDVPNATVMLIEGANRFGLSQLHQFRGRVGRGEHQSYCLLVADTVNPEAEARLTAVETTQDGFKLAEEDLKLRGPGEFFGTRQSGLPELRVARLSDMDVLEQARAAAQYIFEQDPDLVAAEHSLLVQQVNRVWRSRGDLS